MIPESKLSSSRLWCKDSALLRISWSRDSRPHTRILGFFLDEWWWCLAMKQEFWKQVDHDSLRQLNRFKDLTGSLESMSSTTSSGSSKLTMFILIE